MASTPVRELQEVLTQSHASETFKRAVLDLADGRVTSPIQVHRAVPPIKVLRFLHKLLEVYPQEPITAVEIIGRSGCSDFRGEAVIYPSGRKVRFWWDCAWKAEMEGMTTWWGAPDQTLAAQKFGYQCFREFTEIAG